MYTQSEIQEINREAREAEMLASPARPENEMPRKIMARESKRQGIKGINAWNQITGNPEGISDEVLAVLNEPEWHDDHRQHVEMAEDYDAICHSVLDEEALRDQTKYNVLHTDRYQSDLLTDAPKWLQPIQQAMASDKGSDLRTGEKGTPQYRTKLDIVKFQRHLDRVNKRRRYWGIESIVLDKAGRVRGVRDLLNRRDSNEMPKAVPTHYLDDLAL